MAKKTRISLLIDEDIYDRLQILGDGIVPVGEVARILTTLEVLNLKGWPRPKAPKRRRPKDR